VAGKVPQTLEELRAKTQYQPTNDPLGRSQTTAQKIVNRLLDQEVPIAAYLPGDHAGSERWHP